MNQEDKIHFLFSQSQIGSYNEENVAKLYQWHHAYINEKKVPKFDYIYYLWVFFLIFLILIVIIIIYYNIKPDTKLLDDMTLRSNISDGFELMESNEEFDDNGEQIVYETI